ncbi:hypothetical protein BpHYR1_045094 [Brachionus plicatilis]|uniref:Uncharacterized protein n=1 Tax=Brachionus plicatilis TaxID=10195 RepID=A0A3M7T0I8_BRAPC|nr:hypothetical protein BpHYR1_045094 [Brachionus plicatilis]
MTNWYSKPIEFINKIKTVSSQLAVFFSEVELYQINKKLFSSFLIVTNKKRMFKNNKKIHTTDCEVAGQLTDRPCGGRPTERPLNGRPCPRIKIKNFFWTVLWPAGLHTVGQSVGRPIHGLLKFCRGLAGQ